MAGSFINQAIKNVEEAILELTQGNVKSYSIAGRSFTLHNLDELMGVRRKLMSEKAIAANGGVTYANMSGPDSAEPIGSVFGV